MSRTQVSKLAKRVLKTFPDRLQNEIAGELNDGGQALARAMQARAPKKTGATIRGISFRVLAKTLRLRVGLIGTPRGRAKLFYARIQDLGRRAQVVRVERRKRGIPKHLSRGRKIAADIAGTYTMKVPAMAPKRFVTGRFTNVRRIMRGRLLRAFDRAMRSAKGAGA